MVRVLTLLIAGSLLASCAVFQPIGDFLLEKHCTDRSSTSKSSFSPSPNFTSAFRRADTNPKRELPRDRCLSCTKCPGIVLMLRL